jgi:hypothetical protein
LARSTPRKGTQQDPDKKTRSGGRSASARLAEGSEAREPTQDRTTPPPEAVAPPGKRPARRSVGKQVARGEPLTLDAGVALEQAVVSVPADGGKEQRSQPAELALGPEPPQAVALAPGAVAKAPRQSRGPANLRIHLLPPTDGSAPTPVRAPFVLADERAAQSGVNDLGMLRAVADKERERRTALWGTVPASFPESCGLTPSGLAQAISQAPGFDVYLTNPNPHNEALFLNPWHQGYTAHPGFSDACHAVFQAAGLDVADLDQLEPSSTYHSGAGLFGNERFWQSFLDFAEAVVRDARTGVDAAVLEVLDSRKADPKNLHPGATYWNFLVERLVSVYLRRAGSELKIHKIPLPSPDGKMNSHLKRLREMKDVAHRTQSAWMYSCWLHYRNLYLLQIAGKKWCETHLPIISKAEVRFN